MYGKAVQVVDMEQGGFHLGNLERTGEIFKRRKVVKRWENGGCWGGRKEAPKAFATRDGQTRTGKSVLPEGGLCRMERRGRRLTSGGRGGEDVKLRLKK